MKITLPGSELAAAVGWAAALTPAKPAVPILAAVRLDAAEHSLAVSAFDLDTAGSVSVTTESGYTVEDEGTVYLSGRLLAAVAKATAREKAVTLAVEGPQVVVSCGKAARWELPLLDGANYPVLPVHGPTVAHLDPAELGRGLGRVLPALSGEVVPNLRGVSLSAVAGGPMTLAATDKYRLAVAEIGWVAPESGISDGGIAELMLPTELLEAAEAALAVPGGGRLTDDDTVALHLDGQSAGLSTARHTVVGRQLAHDPPRWRRLADRAREDIGTVAVDALREALDRALVVADADAPVAVAIEGDQLTVTVAGAARGAAEHHVEVEQSTGTEQRFGANPRYLRTMLDGLRSPRAKLSLDPKSLRADPTTEDGGDVGGYRHVVALHTLGGTGEGS